MKTRLILLLLLSPLATSGARPKYSTLTPVESAAKVIDGLEFAVVTVNMLLVPDPDGEIEVEPGEKKPAAPLWVGQGTTESVHFKLAFPTDPDDTKTEAEPPGADHPTAPPNGESRGK